MIHDIQNEMKSRSFFAFLNKVNTATLQGRCGFIAQTEVRPFGTHLRTKMAANPDPKEAKTILEFNVQDIDGNEVELSKYKGYVTFIVNLASK